jgi:hypothetical protein
MQDPWRPGRRTLLALFLLAPVHAGTSQVFQVQGGGSSLFEGYGGLLNVWGNGYEASLGVGYLDGLRIGLSGRRLFAGRDTLRFGNDALPFTMETDVFTGGNAIMAQGVGLQRRRGRTSLWAFAGASADPLAAPYFATQRPSRAMGYLRARYDIDRTLSIVSHAVVTDRQTLLTTVRWLPLLGVTSAATVGVGSNVPYGALSSEVHTTHLDLKTAWAALGRGFRRADAPMPLASEVERENILVTWRPGAALSLSAGRQHFRQDSSFRDIPQRATLDQVSFNARVLGASTGGGLFLSEAGGARNLSSFASVRRSIAPRLEGELYLLRVWEPEPARVTTPVLLLRESLSPRLSLLQVITRERRRTSVSFGGTLSTGLGSVELDYQIAHSPYLTADPFVQSIGVNARVQLGSYSFSIGSFVTPDGHVHYSAQGSTFYYRGLSAMPGGNAGQSIRLPDHLVEGVVVDEAGQPVEGAALDIGGEVVYTNSRGAFFQRRSSTGALALRVILTDFLVPGRFEVVSAPATVTPAPEGRAERVKVVVRRLPPG